MPSHRSSGENARKVWLPKTAPPLPKRRTSLPSSSACHNATSSAPSGLIKANAPINQQPLSDEGVLIERFTLADGNTLDYRMTVNDPKVYVAPWTLRIPIPREETYGFFEYACHEGNYAMRNILSAARAEEAAAAGK